MYRATMLSSSGLLTEVALKVLRPTVELDPDAVRRLLDEGRMLGRMNHPVVVRAYDLTRIDGRIGLVTEYVDGDDLDRCMEERIPTRALCAAVGQVAAALHAAWSTRGTDGKPLGIVHRDLKPPNIRIGRHGQVKLLDFGIAQFQVADQRSVRTNSDLVVGSVAYMAPERFVERLSLPAGDVFGLGCCLYEGLTGERFHSDSAMRAVTALAVDARGFERHRSARLASLTGPPALVEVATACLSFDPAKRPPAGEVARALEDLAESLEGPSLRRWCADRIWPPPEPVDGLLEGQTLIEGDLDLAVTPPQPTPAPPPRKLGAPLATIDPSLLDQDDPRQAEMVALMTPSGGRVIGAPTPTAVRPAGREPVLPIGVTLLADEPRIVSIDSIDRKRFGTSVPPVSEPPRSGVLRWLTGIGLFGCAAVSLAVAAAAGLAALALGYGLS